MLLGLIPDDVPRAGLDIGCGTGETARLIAPHMDRVDAIDPSAAMLKQARALSDATTNVTWIESYFETAPLRPPYGIAVAAESLHWTDWPVSLPRIAAALAPGAVLLNVGRDTVPPAWSQSLLELIGEYSTNRDFRPFDLMEELQSRGLYQLKGEWRSSELPIEQTVDAYIETIHSQNGFSRDRMTAAAASAFDDGVRALLESHGHVDTVPLRAFSRAFWGRPQAPP